MHDGSAATDDSPNYGESSTYRASPPIPASKTVASSTIRLTVSLHVHPVDLPPENASTPAVAEKHHREREG